MGNIGLFVIKLGILGILEGEQGVLLVYGMFLCYLVKDVCFWVDKVFVRVQS